jgi:hypothetical protein
MLQSLNNNTNGVEQRHLGLCKLNLLHQSHQTVQYGWCIWEKVVGMKLPLVGNILELASSGNSNDLIVQWIALVHQMLEDLVYNRLLLFRNLDGNPLRDYDSDTTSDDVEAWLLLSCFRNQSILEEGIEVDLVVENISSQANSGVDGVFKEDVFIIRGCRTLARGLDIGGEY